MARCSVIGDGSMAAVSRRRAIVSFHGIRVSGFLGWLMWLAVHLTFMTGFKNRFTALLQWAFSFIGRSRAERALPRSLPVPVSPVPVSPPAVASAAGFPPRIEGEPSS